MSRFYQSANAFRFSPTERVPARQPYWNQPELRDGIVSFHMNVRWFMTVAGIEEDSVGTLAEDGRHRTGTAQRNVRSSDWMNAMPGTFLRLSRLSFVMNRSVPPAAAQAS